MSRRCLPWLVAGAWAAAGCGRHARPAPPGEDLSGLPRAASPALLDQIPASARAVLALRDPWELYEQLRDSKLAGALRAQGLLDDLPALSFVERWEALRARLGELARKPLPDLAALLHGEAAVAWIPGDAGTEGGWLWVERLGPEAGPALDFARVLNRVHASGADVELEERRGVSLRQVRFGPGTELCYYVLADRLVVSTDRVLLERSLELASGGKGSAGAAFGPLEDEARAEGFAAGLWNGRDEAPPIGPVELPREPLWLAGVRRLGVAGHRLTGDLDPAIWGTGAAPTAGLGGEALLLDAAGLELPRAWAAVRPHPAAGAPELPLLAELDRLAGALGRGAWLAAAREPAGAWAPELGLAVAGDAAGPLRRLLADAVERADEAAEALPGGGSLLCPWGEEGPLCVASCPSRLVVSTRERLLAAGTAVCATSTATPAEPPLLALSVRPGDGAPALTAALRRSPGGRTEGSWAAEGAAP